MFFQLLTGILPFYGDSPAALMNQIMNVKHPDPKQINTKIPKPVVTVLDRALEKDREKRYQKASQMAADLREIERRIKAAIMKMKAGSSS
jgi:serine/threonine-protein kinase